MIQVAETAVELECLRACASLNRDADGAVERAQRARLTLAEALDELLPLLCTHTGAGAAWVRTIDEDLSERDFVSPPGANPLLSLASELDARVRHSSPIVRRCGNGERVLAQVLDVAGDRFGSAAIAVDGEVDAARLSLLQALLDTWCEELDGYLAAIARARSKHRITMAIGRALKHPVLDHGITAAIEELAVEVPFDDLVLVYCGEELPRPDALHYRIIRGGSLAYCSLQGQVPDAEPALKSLLMGVLHGERGAMVELGLDRYRQDALVSGMLEEQVIGRLVVGRSRGDFNTFERDLLERFADYMRHRIVDFNREWRTLARSFAQPVVQRLLGEEGYRKTYLSPREEPAAVLYGDISGFTRLSEQVLREPILIGSFIDAWSRGVVDILWRTQGVFDKMIGDCIIGLWGPPFFDSSPAEACGRALQAATAIRDFTRELAASQPGLQHAPDAVGVAIGLNYCPLLVGFFGPNDNYTGFSAGMNNTARLQGLAVRDEILCMESFADAAAGSHPFGELRATRVKNVAEPIRYRALLSSGKRS